MPNSGCPDRWLSLQEGFRRFRGCTPSQRSGRSCETAARTAGHRRKKRRRTCYPNSLVADNRRAAVDRRFPTGHFLETETIAVRPSENSYDDLSGLHGCQRLAPLTLGFRRGRLR